MNGESSLYLGYTIGDGRVAVPKARVKAIREFKRPRTKRGIRAFLGTVGYYRLFIQNYALVARPLTVTTTKKTPEMVEWSEEMLGSFSDLCCSLSDACMLHVPTKCDVFLLQTDASGVGIGSVLSVCREGKEVPVAFYSRQMKERETRYSATEIECLAVLESIRHFEVHLIGRHFTLQTDHKAVESLLTSKVLNRRLTRWALYLQEFCFTSQYRPGSQNANADGLSRQAWEQIEEIPPIERMSGGQQESKITDKEKEKEGRGDAEDG